MRRTLALCGRELFTAFTTPSTYALIIFYLIASATCTLTLGGFIDRNQAALDGFFAWQCWLFLILGAALGMGQWAEEYRTGTIELTLSLPIAIPEIVLAKFLSAWAVLSTALLCTLPFAFTCRWLGNPDPGPMFTGYLGCFLAAGLFLALAQAMSCITNSQFASFLWTLLAGVAALLAGFRPAAILLTKWGLGATALDLISSLGILQHFDNFTDGAPSLGDLLFFLAPTSALLLFTQWRLRRRHRHASARCTIVCWSCIIALMAVASFSHALPMRLDCTEEKLYTLDAHTRRMLAGLRHPVRIELFYSGSNPELDGQTRKYAGRVKQLLGEFQRLAGAPVTIVQSDPHSASAQGAAEERGLKAQITSMGELWFFGAIITSPDLPDRQPQTIPFFDYREEPRLEYSLVRAINALWRSHPPRIGVISTLPVMEHIADRQLKPTWWALQQLMTDFELVGIDPTAGQLPDNPPGLLLIIHPNAIGEQLTAAIRRHLENGGTAIICLDPLCRAEAQMAGPYRLPRPSAMADVVNGWGIALRKGAIVADRKLSTAMTDPLRGLEQLPTLLSVPRANLSSSSGITAYLNKLTMFCAGDLEITPKPQFTATPLAWSSTDSRLLRPYEAQRSAIDILNGFQPDGQAHNLAVLVEGPQTRAVIVADADFLHNSLCLNISADSDNFSEAAAISDNAAFLLNCAEFLTGGGDLIRLRSRGRIRRSFQRLEALGRQTESAIQELAAKDAVDSRPRREQIALIERKGAAASNAEKAQLAMLRAEDGRVIAALKTAQREQLYQLRRKLDHIELAIAMVNAAAIPLILAAIAGIIGYRRRR